MLGALVARDALAINAAFGVEVDALRFETGFKRLFSSPGTLDRFASMQELETLYQGSFLDNIAVRDADVLNEWVEEKQRHLHELYRHLLHEIITLAHQQGSDELGLIYARKLVNLDPLWDAAQRHLMRLLAHTDHANEALQHYEQFAELLADELQAEPETTALYEQIRLHSLKPARLQTRLSITVPSMPFIEPADDVEIAQRMLNTPHCPADHYRDRKDRAGDTARVSPAASISRWCVLCAAGDGTISRRIFAACGRLAGDQHRQR